MNLLESALNLLFPPTCGFCGKINNSYICTSCNKRIQVIQKNKINKYSNKYYKKHFWMFKYDGEIRKLIINYKFNDKSYLYRTFVELICNNKQAIEYISKFDVIIPVPIHKKRLKQRGYNQSELIAKELCKRIKDIELESKLLLKIKNIKPQSTLGLDGRVDNIKGAYATNNTIISRIDYLNKKILLLDDVYTTGSTVNECSKVLSEITKCEIGIFTIAKD